MRRLWTGLCVGLSIAVSGCATYGPPGPGVAYDGFYDDYYGPIHDGYWGDGDVFYYRNHERGRYLADSGGHFRHDMGGGSPGGPPMGGFHPMHGMGPGPGGFHGGGGHHGH